MHGGGGGRPAPVAKLHILSKYFHIEFPVLMWHGNMAVVPIVAVANIKSCHTTLVQNNHTLPNKPRMAYLEETIFYSTYMHIYISKRQKKRCGYI